MPQDFLSLVSIEVLGGGAGASGNYGAVLAHIQNLLLLQYHVGQ